MCRGITLFLRNIFIRKFQEVLGETPKGFIHIPYVSSYLNPGNFPKYLKEINKRKFGQFYWKMLDGTAENAFELQKAYCLPCSKEYLNGAAKCMCICLSRNLFQSIASNILILQEFQNILLTQKLSEKKPDLLVFQTFEFI